MPQHSAGVLFFRRTGDALEVLLVHPGGPFWRGKDRGAWQIPKGLLQPGEEAEAAARREVEEELGIQIDAPLRSLASFKQKGGKRVDAFAAEQDVEPSMTESNTFTIEWPPRSGRIQAFPEIDEARWFTIASARDIMLPSQVVLLDCLVDLLQ